MIKLSESCPIIDDIPFLHSLIIDNKPADPDVVALQDDLRKRNMSVIIAAGSTEAENILKFRPELDIVILDWFLNETDPEEAKYLLQTLRN